MEAGSTANALTAPRWRDLASPAMAPRAALVCLGVWLNAADSLVTATIMPTVGKDLGGWAYFGWAIAVYLTGSIIAGASAGQVTRRVGLRGTAVFSAIVYAAGCAVSAATSGIELFLLGRMLQGLGAGWVVGICYVAVERLFPETLWAKIFAVMAGVWGVATLLGPLLGGLFAGAGFWRGAFWMFAAQGIIFACAAPWLLPGAGETTGAGRFAWRTLLVLTGAIVCVSIANVASGEAAPALFCLLGLALLAVAAKVNARSGEGLLPAQAAQPSTVAGAGYAMIFLFSAASAPLSVFGAAFLQTLYGLTPLAAGYVIGMEALGWTAAALAIAGLSDRRQGYSIVAGAIAIASGAVLLTVAFAIVPLWPVVLAATVLGAGFGLCWAPTARRILTSLGPQEGGVGASAIPTTQLIGSAVGAALVGSVANLIGLTAQPLPPQRASALAPWLFGAFVPIALLGVVAAARIVTRAKREAA